MVGQSPRLFEPTLQFGIGGAGNRMKRINLRSDTQTQPTPEMRRAMAEAPVGDEQLREDPTTNRLIAKVCDLLGKESAIFLPSATMANQIAFAVHAEGGDELIGHRLSHPFIYEAGGPAYLSRIMMRGLDGPCGMFSPEALEAAICPAGNYHLSRSRIMLIENTTNLGGGSGLAAGSTARGLCRSRTLRHASASRRRATVECRRGFGYIGR